MIVKPADLQLHACAAATTAMTSAPVEAKGKGWEPELELLLNKGDNKTSVCV
jgi:hypothetical protein